MIKNFLTIIFLVTCCLGAYAQEEQPEEETVDPYEFRAAFSVGGTVGGDYANEVFSTNAAFDVTYLYNLTKDLKVGGTLGAMYAFQNNSSNTLIKEGDGKFVSFAGTFRFHTDNDKFHIGGDVGYAYGLDEGGFLYRLRLGMQVSKCSGIVASYTEVMDTYSYSAVNIGYEFTF
ncbi:hypothetical protein [Meridianimaribacter flavus]|uniref:Outer membrane protein beta-barrel domain-containing protein n=1 Tax=Meridianimaribacter flavus TaxID=571115 RepID=A0ABY2G5X7_9FLAO|nr:hypothetical protein [Meridianimaribacter flavus]TDY12443.1 hypothetical protein A8975_1207 [Meridianimaribacter flavus]